MGRNTVISFQTLKSLFHETWEIPWTDMQLLKKAVVKD